MSITATYDSSRNDTSLVWKNQAQQEVDLSNYSLTITSGTPSVDDTLSLTYTTLGHKIWNNSADETITLADYNLAITSGVPAVGDTLSLTYTTEEVDISDRLEVQNYYTGIKDTVGTELDTLVYQADGTWINRAGQTVTLEDYAVEIVSGTPLEHDSIQLLYTTTEGNIDYRLTFKNAYLGVKDSAGITYETLTYDSLDNTWEDEEQQPVSLSDYGLTITSGNPINGDKLNLTFTTEQVHYSFAFDRSPADDTTTAKTCTRNELADISTPLNTVLCVGNDPNDYFTLTFDRNYIRLDSNNRNFETIKGIGLKQGQTYNVKIQVKNNVVTLMISIDGGLTYRSYTTDLNEPFVNLLQNTIGCTYDNRTPLENGLFDISDYVIYINDVELYRIKGLVVEGTYRDLLDEYKYNAASKKYVGELSDLETLANNNLIVAINEVNEKLADLRKKGGFLNRTSANTLCSGNTIDGNVALINFGITNVQQNNLVGEYSVATSANETATIELVGGGGCLAKTNGSDDAYLDTENGWLYWHDGGSGAYFKGIFKAPVAGTLKVITPKSGEDKKGKGADSIAYFVYTETIEGEETEVTVEVARASGGASGYPSVDAGFLSEVAGGTATYDEEYFTEIIEAQEGFTGKVYKQQYIGVE